MKKYIILIPLVALLLTFVVKYYSLRKEAEIKAKHLLIDKIEHKKYKVKTTVYNPTKGQTDNRPFETADGSIIDPLNPQRWCAVSRDLLKKYGGEFNFGDTILVTIKDCPYLNGEWIIHDTTSDSIFDNKINTKRSVRKMLDLLISNPHVARIEGCWNGKLKKY